MNVTDVNIGSEVASGASCHTGFINDDSDQQSEASIVDNNESDTCRMSPSEASLFGENSDTNSAKDDALHHNDDEARLTMAKELVSTGRPVETCIRAMHLMHDDIEKATNWLLSPASQSFSRAVYFCCDDEPRTVEDDDSYYNFESSRHCRDDYEHLE